MQKRIGLVIREKLVEEIKERLNNSHACFFVGFDKLEAASLNVLRDDLRKINSIMRVFKNSLIKRALVDLGRDGFEEFLQGSTGLVFVYQDDIVKTCKLLVDFSKDSEDKFFLKGGYIEDRRIEKEEVLEIAKLPSRDVLLSMALSGIASPLTGFLNTLNQIILKFVWVIEEIKKKKE